MRINVRVISLSLCATLAAVTFAHEGHDHAQAPGDALAVTHAVLLGGGEYRYETVPNWSQLPEGRETLGPTHGGIVVDRDGNLYFTMDGGPNAILVYKPDGTFLRALGDESLTGIHGVAINDENGEQFIYAAHLKGRRALKLKLDGEIVWTIGFDDVKQSGKYENEGQFSPTAIAVAPDGGVFIADGYGQNWIHKFDKDQNYVTSFGGKGEEPGQFRTCHGMGMDRRGEKPLLLVCDRENRRLQHFDLDGNFVAIVTEGLRRPCSVSFHDGKVVIAELEARVTILDQHNNQVAHLGDNPNREHWANYHVPPAAWQPGIFTAPHGVSFDPAGNIYVMDWNASGRVSKLRRADAAIEQAAAGE